MVIKEVMLMDSNSSVIFNFTDHADYASKESSKVRKSEAGLSYRGSIKRDWEAALAKELKIESIEYNSVKEQDGSDTKSVSTDEYNSQAIGNYSDNGLLAITGFEKQLNLYEISEVVTNPEVLASDIKLFFDGQIVDGKYSQLQMCRQLEFITGKSLSSKSESFSTLHKYSDNSESFPEEFGHHISLDGEKLKVWVRNAKLDKSDVMQIAKMLEAEFANGNICLCSVCLNGDIVWTTEAKRSLHDVDSINCLV